MISQSLLPEFDQEMKTTRRIIENAQTEKFAWKPHDKSFSFGDLATHVAQLVSWGSVVMSSDELDIGGNFPRPQIGSTQDILDLFDKNVADTRAALANASDEEFMKPWTLRKGDHTVFTLPKVAVVRAMVMNHIIHHRGQLSVYLRLNDIPVPSIYGPSADEQVF
ncbi:MAG TPA: DinB family protein [Thermoanaerobaculia bacterium]